MLVADSDVGGPWRSPLAVFLLAVGLSLGTPRALGGTVGRLSGSSRAEREVAVIKGRRQRGSRNQAKLDKVDLRPTGAVDEDKSVAPTAVRKSAWR